MLTAASGLSGLRKRRARHVLVSWHCANSTSPSQSVPASRAASATSRPPSWSSAVIRLDPYVSPDCAWFVRIRRVRGATAATAYSSPGASSAKPSCPRARHGARGSASVADKGAGPYGIATGPDGALWFRQLNPAQSAASPAMKRSPRSPVLLPDRTAEPHVIVAASTGDCWFTEWGANRIGPVAASSGERGYVRSTE